MRCPHLRNDGSCCCCDRCVHFVGDDLACSRRRCRPVASVVGAAVGPLGEAANMCDRRKLDEPSPHDSGNNRFRFRCHTDFHWNVRPRTAGRQRHGGGYFHSIAISEAHGPVAVFAASSAMCHAFVCHRRPHRLYRMRNSYLPSSLSMPDSVSICPEINIEKREKMRMANRSAYF